MSDTYVSSKLTQEQITEMVVLYENGTYTQEELGKKFGISLPTTNKILKARGAQKGIAGSELIEQIKKRLDAEANAEEEQKKQEIKLAKKESALWPRIVGTCIIKEVSELNKTKDKKEVERIQARVRILKDASIGLANAMNQRWRALGIDDNITSEEIPDLVIEDLTKEKIRELHQKNRFNPDVEVKNMNVELDLENLNLDLEDGSEV